MNTVTIIWLPGSCTTIFRTINAILKKHNTLCYAELWKMTQGNLGQHGWTVHTGSCARLEWTFNFATLWPYLTRSMLCEVQVNVNQLQNIYTNTRCRSWNHTTIPCPKIMFARLFNAQTHRYDIKITAYIRSLLFGDGHSLDMIVIILLNVSLIFITSTVLHHLL